MNKLIKTKNNQSGTSFLEFAVGLPIILLLLMGTVDLGMAVNQYLAITRATYEGMRYGASLYNNQPGCKGPECLPEDQSNTNLNEIDGRIKQILSLQGYTNSSVTVKSTTWVDTQNGENHEYNMLQATVEVPFQSTMPLFDLFPIRAEIKFSDLFRDVIQPYNGEN